MIAISVSDAAILYLIPIGFIVALWLVCSLIVYALVHSRLEFDFKGDLLRKFEDRQGLPSTPSRLSFSYIAKLLLGDNCVQAAFLYRISHFFAKGRSTSIAVMIHALSRLLTHADISPWAQIGPGLYIYHGHGTVLGKGVRAGNRLLVCQGASVARAAIGDDVKIWAGAQVVGAVTIGDRSEVGANAVVIADVPADSIVFGVPARLAGKKPAPQAPAGVADGDMAARPPVEAG